MPFKNSLERPLVATAHLCLLHLLCGTLLDQPLFCCLSLPRPAPTQHNLCNRVHMMGGSIRKDMTGSVTHVVAHTVSGSKYKVAVGLETPIMSEEWVMKAWDARNNM